MTGLLKLRCWRWAGISRRDWSGEKVGGWASGGGEMGLRGEQDGCSLCSGVPQGKMTIDRLLITKS